MDIADSENLNVHNDSNIYLNDTVEIVSDSDGSDTEMAVLDHGDNTNETNFNVNNFTNSLLPEHTTLTGNAKIPIKDEPTLKDDCDSPTRKTCKEKSTSEIDEEAECCPICFEPWTNSGEHRLCSLKCGHLFGQSCIEKWLAGQGGKCPHCNSKASKKDIRVIYAKALKMTDTTEKDQALFKLEKEREARKKAELESAETKLRYQLALDEVKKLKAELENCKSRVNMTGRDYTNQGTTNSINYQPALNCNSECYVLEKTLKISEIGGCRVMAYCHSNSVVCMSQPSTNQLFPGFGVKKLSTLDFKTSQYISVHSKAIRDLCFNSNNPNGFMLSCSVDKTVKVTSLNSNTVVQSYSCPAPVWSCSWNVNDFNCLYAGLQNGTVLSFDMRNTSQHVHQFNSEGSRSPVLSLHYVVSDNTDVSSEGVLVAQLERCSFFAKQANGENKVNILPIEGSLTSLDFDENTNHMLVTLRPNASHSHVRHSMHKLISENIMDTNLFSTRNIHTFTGGRTQKLLSKNKLVPHPTSDGNLLVCASDEASQSVLVWDAATGIMKQKLPSNSAVMDLCYVGNNQSNYLVTLTEKQAAIYKWR